MFIAYDKDGKEHKYTHEIDYKEGIGRCGFTPDPLAKKPEKPASKKEIKAIVTLAGKNDVDIIKLENHLGIVGINVLTKDQIPKAEEYITFKEAE